MPKTGQSKNFLICRLTELGSNNCKKFLMRVAKWLPEEKEGWDQEPSEVFAKEGEDGNSNEEGHGGVERDGE